MKNICILGATGSIGTQTLEVLKKETENFNLISISANNNYIKVIEIIKEFHPPFVAMMEEEGFLKVKDFCKENGEKIEVLMGMEGLCKIASLKEVDIVVTSIVGMIGLKPTITAIRAGKDIALANKETLVVGGDIVIREAKERNVKILPVDSEHGAIFQCLNGENYKDIKKILLTASGGPFRGKDKEYLENVTVEGALAHPKWNMGKKISIDSATLMNKGLEVIEAHHLFNISFEDITVVVHPQSIVHSMVEFIDGSIIAQMAEPDMKLPIQYALNYPIRKESVISRLDLFKIKTLTFEEADRDTFKCLNLAFDAGRASGIMPTILNSANEEAVEMFLNKKIKFLQIGDIIEEALNHFPNKEVTLDNILETDILVRDRIRNIYK